MATHEFSKAKPAGKSGGAGFTSVQTKGDKGIPKGVPKKTWSQTGKVFPSFASKELSGGPKK